MTKVQCYGMLQNQISVLTQQMLGTPVPCSDPRSGTALCCGEGDECLPGGLCYSSNYRQDPAKTGYYVGGCTDSSFLSVACPQWCSTQKTADVVFKGNSNTTTSVPWNCCGGQQDANGNNIHDCTNPTQATFQALPPNVLQSFSHQAAPEWATDSTSNSSAASPTASNAVQTGTSSSTPSSAAGGSNTAGPISGLSTPAIAGISVAIAVFVLSGIALAAMFLFRRWRRQLRQELDARMPAAKPSPPQSEAGGCSHCSSETSSPATSHSQHSRDLMFASVPYMGEDAPSYQAATGRYPLSPQLRAELPNSIEPNRFMSEFPTHSMISLPRPVLELEANLRAQRTRNAAWDQEYDRAYTEGRRRDSAWDRKFKAALLGHR